MTIYLARTFTHEFLDGFYYAYIPVNKELAQTVLTRRKAFLEAHKLDEKLSHFQYRDYSVNYLPYSEALDEFLADTDDECKQVPEDFVPPDDVERTECDHMMIDQYGVYWTCQPKYVDGMAVETQRIPYGIFEAEL